MTKEIFLKTLKQKLFWDMPQEKIEEEIKKYISFFEKADSERSEEELVAECGDINLIVDEIISEYKTGQNVVSKKKKSYIKGLDSKTRFIITLASWLFVYVICILMSWGGTGVGAGDGYFYGMYDAIPGVIGFFRELKGNFLVSLILFLIPTGAIFITMCSRDQIDEKMNMKKIRLYYLFNILILAFMALIVWAYTILPIFRMLYGDGPLYEGVPFVSKIEMGSIGGVLSGVLMSCLVLSTLLGIFSGISISKLGIYCFPFTFIYASIMLYLTSYNSLLNRMDSPEALMSVFMENHNILLLGVACAIMAFVTVYIARREL